MIAKFERWIAFILAHKREESKTEEKICFVDNILTILLVHFQNEMVASVVPIGLFLIYLNVIL